MKKSSNNSTSHLYSMMYACTNTNNIFFFLVENSHLASFQSNFYVLGDLTLKTLSNFLIMCYFSSDMQYLSERIQCFIRNNSKRTNSKIYCEFHCSLSAKQIQQSLSSSFMSYSNMAYNHTICNSGSALLCSPNCSCIDIECVSTRGFICRSLPGHVRLPGSMSVVISSSE